MELLQLLVSAVILIVWIALSLGLALTGAVCVGIACGRRRRVAIFGRAALMLVGLACLGTAAMHNPLTIHIAQQARAAEMRKWQGRTLAEFKERYGPPDFGFLPFLSWRTLPWYSPLRWGSVTLAVVADGRIGAVMVRGFREAFS